MGQLDKGHLRPLQKNAYTCMAKCCDTAPTPHELQHCTAACEHKVQAANQLIAASIRDFQERLQRCVQVGGTPKEAGVVPPLPNTLRPPPPPCPPPLMAAPPSQRCQDKAQEVLPPQPGERDIERAQESLAKCAGECALEYSKQTPKLGAEIVERLKQIK